MKISFSSLITLVFLIFQFSVIGQENIVVTGNDIQNSNGSVSYSLGQISYHSINTVNGSVGEGVQQPFEILLVSVEEVENNVTINVDLYPNPVSNYIILNTEQYEGLQFQLFSVNGKKLNSGTLMNKETKINMKELAKSTYFLKIQLNNQSFQTYKIIKN